MAQSNRSQYRTDGISYSVSRRDIAHNGSIQWGATRWSLIKSATSNLIKRWSITGDNHFRRACAPSIPRMARSNKKNICTTDIKTAFQWYSADMIKSDAGTYWVVLGATRHTKESRTGNIENVVAYSLQSVPWVTRPWKMRSEKGAYMKVKKIKASWIS